MQKNLTPFQQKLVDDLIQEFTKINPKPTDSGTKRFSFDTIDECNKEEQRFKDTIKKHNETMMKVFVNQFNDEIKAFKKEFGKVLDIQIGYSINNVHSHRQTFENFVSENKANPLSNNQPYEMQIFLVSKKKLYKGEPRWNYCNGKAQTNIFADFNRELIRHNLDSGKEVTAYKIIGLEYRTHEYLYKERGTTETTLDGLIQATKSIQTRIVELAN
jgi:hypothetical protein